MGIHRQKRLVTGVIAGSVAGVVTALALMAYMASQGRSIWTNPNLIAVMWMGPDAAGSGLAWATLAGFATHMGTSAVVGLVAVPFIRELPPWRTVLVSAAYAVASYPVVFAFVLTWANPLMVERTDFVLMTLAHALFGVVQGWVYLRLRPEERRLRNRVLR